MLLSVVPATSRPAGDCRGSRARTWVESCLQQGWHGILMGAWHCSCLWKVSSGNKQKKEFNRQLCQLSLQDLVYGIIVALTQWKGSSVFLSMTFRSFFLRLQSKMNQQLQRRLRYIIVLLNIQPAKFRIIEPQRVRGGPKVRWSPIELDSQAPFITLFTRCHFLSVYSHLPSGQVRLSLVISLLIRAYSFLFEALLQ